MQGDGSLRQCPVRNKVLWLWKGRNRWNTIIRAEAGIFRLR